MTQPKSLNALGCNVEATAELSPDILAELVYGILRPPSGKESKHTRCLFTKRTGDQREESAYLSSVHEARSPELEGTCFRPLSSSGVCAS